MARRSGDLRRRRVLSDILQRMRSNPSLDWSVSQCRQGVPRVRDPGVLPLGHGGSHFKVSHPSQREILTVPFRRPIKPVYIRKLVRFIDAVRDANAKT